MPTPPHRRARRSNRRDRSRRVGPHRGLRGLGTPRPRSPSSTRSASWSSLPASDRRWLDYRSDGSSSASRDGLRPLTAHGEDAAPATAPAGAAASLPLSGWNRSVVRQRGEADDVQTHPRGLLAVPEYRVRGGWTKTFTACPTDWRGSLQARAVCRLHDHL